MGHSIHVQPSGHRFVAEQGESILDAALRQGFTLPYNCRNGACGTCIGRVLEGRVRYEERWPALADLDTAQGEALFCHAIPEGDLVIASNEIAVPPEVRIRTLPCKVVKKELLCHDVMRLWLKPPEALPLRFLAGQYLDILTPEGHRSFSIANAPEESNLIELHIRHVDGGEFTHYIFHELQEKTVWRIEAPLGTFFLRQDTDRPVLLMGGGTGFAPLKGILEHAFRSGDERPMHLFWGVRALHDLYLPDLPRQWEREHPNFRFTPVLSHPLAEDDWDGETGFVHETLLRAYPDLSGYDLYMSGPPAMIHAARDEFLEHGLNRERAFSDAFEFNSLPGHAAA
jgi:CDP-4-dehydro-6-deoxyglucose reductase